MNDRSPAADPLAARSAAEPRAQLLPRLREDLVCTLARVQAGRLRGVLVAIAHLVSADRVMTLAASLTIVTTMLLFARLHLGGSQAIASAPAFQLADHPDGRHGETTPRLANGPQFFVSTTGDDAHPGTRSQPWRSIQKAMDSAVAGSIVHIRGGTYEERLAVNVQGSAGAPITFQPYGFSVPAGGCGGYTGVVCGGEEVIIELSSFGNPVTDGIPYLAIKGRSHVRIRGLTFRNYAVNGSMQRGVRIHGGSSHVEISYNKFLRIRHVGRFVTSNALLHFWVEGPGTDIAVRRNEFGDIRSAFGEAMTIAATDVRVEDNWIHHTDGIAVAIGNTGGFGASKNIIVRGNLLEWISKKPDGTYWNDAPAAVVYVNGGNTVLIERNIVRDSALAFQVCSEPGYPKSHGVIIRSNLAYRSHVGAVVGTWYSTTDGSTVHSVKVLNNTFYRNDVGLLVRPYDSATVVWKNNLVASNATSVSNSVGWPVGTMNHNLYYGGGAGPDVNKVVGDPQFVNAAAGDFRVSSTSPAIGAGDPSAAVRDVGRVDLAGRPRIRNGRVDIGAYEIQ